MSAIRPSTVGSRWAPSRVPTASESVAMGKRHGIVALGSVVVATTLWLARHDPAGTSFRPTRDAESGAHATDDLAAPSGPDVPQEVDEKIALGGRLAVKVTSKADGTPIADATVTASIDVRFREEGPYAFSFERHVVTDVAGAAVFDHFPTRRTITVRAEADGMRGSETTVNVSRRDGESSVAFALVPGLSRREASSHVAFDGGVVMPGARLLVDDHVTKRDQVVEVGGDVFVDDDPAGAASHEAEVRLLLPGYVGPARTVALLRGSSLVVRPPEVARKVQEIAFVDENGFGVEGVELRIWPADAVRARPEGTLLVARTDTRGVASVDGYEGSTWDIELVGALVHPLEPMDAHRVVVGSGLHTVRCARRVVHRLVLDGELDGDVGVVTADWTSYEPYPRSAVEALFRADAAEESSRVERYRASLPTRLRWGRSAAGRHEITVALLPGIHSLHLACGDAVGGDVTVEVGAPERETVVVLGNLLVVRVELEGSVDRSDGRPPYAAAVFGHRAGFDERIRLLAGLGGWSDRAANVGREGTHPEGTHIEEFLDRMWTMAVERVRAADPSIGHDLGFVGRDGVASLRVRKAPTEVTLLLPDGRAVIVPVTGDVSVVRGRVDPARVRWLALDVRTARGDALAGARVGLESVARLRRRASDHDYQLAVDRSGRGGLTVLPGDVVGLDPVFDRWHVAPGAGVDVETIPGADAPSYAVRIAPDVREPVLEITVESAIPRGR